MSAVLAARMGDEVGNHGSGLFAGLGMGLGLIAGALVGAALVVAVVATGGAVLVVAAAVAGAIALTAGAGAASERLGESFDNDVAVGTPCSTILMGLMTVLIEGKPAARVMDPTVVCMITKSPGMVKQGSKTVFIGGKNAARHKDLGTCTGSIIPQSLHTEIGGPPADCGAPSQKTMASFFHDMGSALEEEAKWAGYAALALGGAAVVVAGATAALAASAAGATFTASVGAGATAMIPGTAGIIVGKAGEIDGEAALGWVGGKIDSAAGYKDGRFEKFGKSAGGMIGGILGGKVAEGAFPAAHGEGGGGGKGGEGGSAAAPEAPAEAPQLKFDENCTSCAGDSPAPPPKTPDATAPADLPPPAQTNVSELPAQTQADVAASPKLGEQVTQVSEPPAKASGEAAGEAANGKAGEEPAGGTPADEPGALKGAPDAPAEVTPPEKPAGGGAAEGEGANDKPPEVKIEDKCPTCDEAEAKASAEKAARELSPADLEKLAASNETTPAAAAARRVLAEDFYRKNGFNDADISSHVRCIDTSKPVSLVKMPPPATLYQQTFPGKTGQYFTDSATTTPDQLGINPNVLNENGQIVPRQPESYTMDPNNPTTGLQSTAAPANDTWSVKGQPYQAPGGGNQIMVPRGQQGGISQNPNANLGGGGGGPTQGDG